MVILNESPHPGFEIVFFRPGAGADSPVVKEYLSEVPRAKERLKIECVLERLRHSGLSAPGLRFEKIKGSAVALYEIKVKGFGVEHRFLAGFAPFLSPEGRPVFVLLKYVKKKERRLSRTDIETAAARLARVA